VPSFVTGIGPLSNGGRDERMERMRDEPQDSRGGNRTGVGALYAFTSPLFKIH